MVAPDGSLWIWGNRRGLDFGVARSFVPQRVGKDRNWKQVAAGFYGLVALKRDGTLWSMGMNAEGFLGRAGAKDGQTLERIGTDDDWQELKAGVAHCLALKKNGTLWAWGQNMYGQIGVGFASPKMLPTRVGADTNWIAISPGAFQSYALRRDGTIWEWGQDFTTAGGNTSPRQLGEKTNWVSISSGEYHLAALAADGTVWIAGANAGLISVKTPNKTTNLLQVDTLTNCVEITSGENCIFGKKQDGSWLAEGDSGLNGSWTFPAKFAPIAFRSQRGTTLMLMGDGRLWSLRKRIGATHFPGPIENLRNIILHLLGQNPSIVWTDQIDSVPFLIWEMSHQR